MIRDTGEPTLEQLTWPELLKTLVEECSVVRIEDGSRVMPCPFSLAEKICRVKEVTSDDHEHEYDVYCVETLVVVKDGRAVKAGKDDYCPIANADLF